MNWNFNPTMWELDLNAPVDANEFDFYSTVYHELIHALGWSRQEAIDYLVANSPQAENNIVNEVERYIAWPGQALAYKTGQREMLKARARAEEALGADFDIKAFHDTLLGSGSVPMPTMHRLVDEFAQ